VQPAYICLPSVNSEINCNPHLLDTSWQSVLVNDRQSAMSPNPLSETIFKTTTEGKMSNVTQQPGDCIDIWPYVRVIQETVQLPRQVIDSQFVEYVYRSQFNHYDHVLIPTGRSNVFVVIIVDTIHGSVYGHRVLDLIAEYGLAAPTS
jgi:hypothetical protein